MNARDDRVPLNLQYTAEHEWLLIDGDHATVGITAFAADALGDVVFVQLPEVGDSVTAGQACGEVESTKSASDFYAPADGEVVQTNPVLADDPALLNRDPYGSGWLFVLRVTGTPALLDAGRYQAFIGAEK